MSSRENLSISLSVTSQRFATIAGEPLIMYESTTPSYPSSPWDTKAPLEQPIRIIIDFHEHTTDVGLRYCCAVPCPKNKNISYNASASLIPHGCTPVIIFQLWFVMIAGRRTFSVSKRSPSGLRTARVLDKSAYRMGWEHCKSGNVAHSCEYKAQGMR